MNRLCQSISIAALMIAAGTPARAQAVQTGTFEFWICSGSCRDPKAPNVYASGLLVLMPEAVTLDSVPNRMSVQWTDGLPNACFVFLSQRKTGADG